MRLANHVIIPVGLVTEPETQTALYVEISQPNKPTDRVSVTVDTS